MKLLTTTSFRLYVAMVGILHVAILAWGAIVHSPTFVEVGLMPAGIMNWRFHKFDLFCVNPPFVRMVATLPVLAADPNTDWSRYRAAPGLRTEFPVGDGFIRANGPRAFHLFAIARIACIPFSLLGAWTCYRWASDLYGSRAGLMSLTLWCFCPNILANAQTIHSDLAAATLGTLACYLLWRWVQGGDWRPALWAGIALGLALGCKTSWILLLGAVPIYWIARLARNKMPFWRKICSTGTMQGAAIGVLALLVLNTIYGFDGFGTLLGQYEFESFSLSGKVVDEGPGSNRLAGTILGGIPVLLPKYFVKGIDIQKHDFEQGKLSYLAGEFRRGGWWYYYLYVLGVKMPLGSLLLFAAAIAALVVRWHRGQFDTAELFVVVPCVALLLFVSAQTGINRHFRYVLPVLPFAFVLTSGVARDWSQSRFGLRAVVYALLMWSVGSSLLTLPHSMSYFNELAGGPQNGHAHLLTSNIDYGQDILHLRRWLRQNPRIGPIHLACWVAYDPRAADIEFSLPPPGPNEQGLVGRMSDSPKAVPLGPVPGWHIVSVNFLRGYEAQAPTGNGKFKMLHAGEYTYFQRFTPVDRIGYTLYVYHITPEQAREARRRRLGLPPLDQQQEDSRGGSTDSDGLR